MSEKKQFQFKVLLLGDGAVGKTSIREQYMGAGFKGSYSKTVGADFASKVTEVDGHKITFQIFDLAGQDVYKIARKAFYKGGVAAFLVFDLQDAQTMHNLKTWIDDAIANSNGSIGTFIALGNKADLVDTRQVSNEMAIEHFQRLAAETGITFVFLETSALTGMNIQKAFDLMAVRLLSKFNIDVALPDDVELITPGSKPVTSTPSATTSTTVDNQEIEKLQTQITSLQSTMDSMTTRIETLETRFNKLAQIVKKLVEDSKK